jgi:aminocarboxymuconate-semialdehyde decarboxylase
MPNRRDFVKKAASATAGIFVGGGLVDAGFRNTQTGAAPRRRTVSLGGRQIRTMDVHAHCAMPDALAIVKGSNLEPVVKTLLENKLLVLGPERLRAMDQQGIDVEALSINAYWYGAERAMARDLVKVQNEKLAAWCAARPDRFVGLAGVALQHPDLAAEQLDEGIRKFGLRGVAIGGSVEGEDLAARRFDPFWAKAEELGIMVFMHPQAGSPGTTQNPRLQGKGGLTNTIGNPLETTVFLSHLIFEGTLDRFPGLKICAAHAGGFLASYSGRSDALCGRGQGDDCRSLKKRPSQYFKKELYVDTIVFRPEGLRHLVAECGVSQIVYGTDYPFDWPVTIDLVLNASFLSNVDKEAILGGNLAKLLQLPS